MCLGIPGKIIEIWEDRGTRMAHVDFGGAIKDVCLAYLPDIQLGDYTIVHAGFALTRLDEASALETLRMFEELGILDQELGLVLDPGPAPEPVPESALEPALESALGPTLEPARQEVLS